MVRMEAVDVRRLGGGRRVLVWLHRKRKDDSVTSEVEDGEEEGHVDAR